MLINATIIEKNTENAKFHFDENTYVKNKEEKILYVLS